MVQPSYPQQAPYQQSPYPQQQPDGRIVSLGEWMLMILVMMIPLVGLIMMLVWAFGNDGSMTKSNYFKAALLWGLIILGIYVIIFVAFGAAIFGAMQNQSGF